MSPEFVIKAGSKGGTIDFFIARKKWGLELLRNRDRLVEHMERFEPGGQYFGMIQMRDMKQYIVLDFTVTPPVKPHPGNAPLPLFPAVLTSSLEYRGHLYHVLFSNNYRDVQVIDASDLRPVNSFTLMEDANPIARN